MRTKTNRLAVLGLLVAYFLFSFQINASSASAYTASITTNDSISFDISPSGDGTSIHSESINVQSDCRAGYNLTIATPEGSSLYKYENNTQAGTASFTAVDGTSALNSDNNTNKWGYTLTTNPTSSTVFLPLSSTQAVLKTPSQTASSEADINNTFDINYGAKVSDSVDPGTYQMANNGAIVYYLTMDTTCTQYTVSFNANGGTGTMENQGIEIGESTKLTSADSLTAPQGASYTDAGNNTITGDPDKLWTFWGWNTAIDGTGDWYKDKEEVEDLASVGSTITLYAQWKQATLADMTTGTSVTTEKVIDHNEMQDMSPETCYNSTAYSTDTSSDAHNPYDASTNPNGYHTITLLDYRGKVTTGENPESPESYTVSKLPDNLCWMTKDLNLGRESGGENNNGTVTLTSEDTDLADDATFTLPASPTAYTTGTDGYYTSQILINHTVPSYTVNSISYSPTIGHYSWAAATATNTSISDTGDIATSVCPKNWDLPNRIQFYNLRTKGSITSSTIAHEAPYNFVYGGYRNAAEGYYNQTSYGYYWTSSNSSAGYGYWNYVYSSGIYSSSTSSGYKYYGAKVRCVASQGGITVNYDGNGTTEYPTTGEVASQTNVEINSASAQPGTGFTRFGWTFSNWNTEPDGSGISVAANASLSALGFSPNETITLYAQWNPQYNITYVNNCYSYASNSAACTQDDSVNTSEQKINIDSSGNGSGTLAGYNKWTMSGWKIKGWSIVSDNASGANAEYQVSERYQVTNANAGDGITLYAHWVPVYSIQYDGNGADNSNGMGTINASTGVKTVRQINIGEGDPVRLLASNFKRAGYSFVGWSTNPNATVNGNDKIYGPNERITAFPYPNNDSGIITLYGVWIEAEKDSNNNPIYLQDFGPTECSNLTRASFDKTTKEITAGSVIALTDKRDNEVYAVARLADGRCWMIENLRLEAPNTVGNNMNDSSVTNESLSQGYGGVFTGLANAEAVSAFKTTNANSLYSLVADGNKNVIEGGDQYRFPRYNNDNIVNALSSPSYTVNLADPYVSNPSTTGTYPTSSVSSYGNYYTWSAAMANTNSGASYTSLCSSGWTLPSGDSKVGNFSLLYQAYDGENNEHFISNLLRSYPNNFMLSGEVYIRNSPTLYGRGSSGYYWSRTSDSSILAYYLLMQNGAGTRNDGSVGPSNSDGRGYGKTVRCFVDDSYSIQYDGNGADNLNGMGTLDVSTGEKSIQQTNVSEGMDVNLLASNFKRDGYGFVGWSFDPDAWTHFTDDDTTNDSDIYGPAETIKAPARPASGIKPLYAIWAPAKTSGGNPVYLQDFGVSECATLTETDFDATTGRIIVDKDNVVALTDKRDNQVYTIARLADGNCWMVENLRLESAGTMGNNVNDSNVTNQSLAQGYGGTIGQYGSFVGLADPESSGFNSNAVANSVYKSSASSPVDTYDPILGTLEDIGTTNSPGHRFPRYNNTNTNNLVDEPTYVQDYYIPSNPSDVSGNYRIDSNIHSYGNYYSFAAAMANTDYFADSSSSESAGTSICPYGWHLPSSGDTTKEFAILSQSYGGTGGEQNATSSDGAIMSRRFRTFPNNFLYSGGFSGSSVGDHGTTGFYWSRSAYSRDNAYYLRLSSSYFSPSTVYGLMGNLKYFGFNVRCLVSGS
ncbi:InlB B-repeat-containing protein [Candidatus Saccharibacteria bacterium]|nr:InlB B-repeat-containing protein [Candidatus Saccharibacteria bacterium]